VLKGIVDGMDKNYTVSTISGDVNSNERQLRVEAFQAGEIDILVCNTMAAKEGITLTAADTVLFLEREWVPTDEEQAEDRVYRIGQESQSVSAVYLSVVNSIDEHFDRVVEAKREVVRAVLDGGDVQERQSLVKELVKRLKQQNGWTMEE
jgi:SNF2 family DNA or RNA helicase